MSTATSRHLQVERNVEGPDGNIARVTINLSESPLLWLHSRGKLSDRQFGAGERLRRDWEHSGLPPRTTMRWDGMPAEPCRSAPARGLAGGQLAARDRFHAAVAAAGRGLADILWRVVCAGESLTAAENALQWPSRSAKLVLGFALDRVADFYRL
jgi:hypothetical protein